MENRSSGDPPSSVLHTRSDSRQRLLEVAKLFTRLGFTAFGGPPAHVAMMEDEVVRRRGWIDRQHFLDIVAAVNFVPGPNSTELAIHIGYIRAGVAGLVVAGACFIIPAMLIILPLAWMYVTYGSLPHVGSSMRAINACVVGIVAAALLRFAQAALTDRFTVGIAIASAAAGFAAERFARFQPELLILACAAALGTLYYGRPKLSGPMLALAPALLLGSTRGDLARMTLSFLKIGATLFGSGYVLVSYLQSSFVDQYHWLTPKQLLDAVAVGQVTPGPLLTTATFVGYVLGHGRFGGGVTGGILGGVLATIGIFLPSFLFIALLGRVLPRIRSNRFARGALTAMNAAVVALILVVTIRLARPALLPDDRLDLLHVGIAAAALLVLLRFDLNSSWLIILSAAAGALRGVWW